MLLLGGYWVVTLNPSAAGVARQCVLQVNGTTPKARKSSMETKVDSVSPRGETESTFACSVCLHAAGHKKVVSMQLGLHVPLACTSNPVGRPSLFLQALCSSTASNVVNCLRFAKGFLLAIKHKTVWKCLIAPLGNKSARCLSLFACVLLSV